MKVAFVGLGRVARAFARALAGAGHSISPSFDSDARQRQRWSEELGFSAAGTIEAAVAEAELLFITTPDDAVAVVAGRLSALRSLGRLSAVFHTSGVLAASVLSGLGARGVGYASIHPVMTFSGSESDVGRIRGSTFCVEADSERSASVARGVCEQMGAEVVLLSGKSKVLHHLACVLASNFPLALLGAAVRVESDAGVPGDVGLKMLGHLASVAVKNARSQGPGLALTGPFARGDVGTIRLHLEWLKANSPELMQLYLILARETLRLALDAGHITKERAEEVEVLLGGETVG